ncbi:hypothetical protein [Dyadobacter sandarakinus]|uniref:Uncharacterized protein n=1 Tax=Dyadobacter sandarakinus TaxID=2747268 RepID=A0ABX7I321_9BACT|nr:hypothetical protein [Dyadobacter sandarakinus]QRR00224.1 hypothetical protein HWI92_04550 [Dyadobacter sandarakinus]
MVNRHFWFFNEVPEFQLRNYRHVLEFTRNGTRFGVYGNENKYYYYLHDGHCDRLFTFRAKDDLQAIQREDFDSILIDYYLCYPKNQSSFADYPTDAEFQLLHTNF